MKPIIGISTAWSKETWPKNNGGHKAKQQFYYVESSYVNAIYRLGGIPLLITPSINEEVNEEVENKNIRRIINKIDGLILSGGGDIGINPSEGYVPFLVDQQPKRYHFEFNLIKEAWNKNLPTLGICRGHQMIAETLGGSITDVPILNHAGMDGIHDWNTLEIKSQSFLSKIIDSVSWQVNSYHTQAIQKVPPFFRIAAVCKEDNIIEAIESIDKKFFLGVQFHPEKLIMNDENSVNLLRYFINQAQVHC